MGRRWLRKGDATPPTGRAPERRPLLAGADHLDVETAECGATLREFVASLVGWRPGWMGPLFRARSAFARLLRLREPDIPAGPRPRPAELPFAPGG